MAGVKEIQYVVPNVIDSWTQPRYVDESIQKWEYAVLQEQNATVAQNNGVPQIGSRYSFKFTDQSAWVLPSRATVSIMYQVVDSTNAVVASTADEIPAPSVNFPIFDSAYLRINGVDVETQNQYLGRKMLFKNLLDYSQDNTNSYLGQYWFPDSGIANTALDGDAAAPTPGGGDIYTALTEVVAPAEGGAINVNAVPNPQFNKGFYMRRQLLATNRSNYHEVCIPLNRIFDVLAVDRVYCGVPISFDLICGNNLNNLFQCALDYRETNTPFTAKIQHIQVYMPCLQLSPLVDAPLKATFAKYQMANYAPKASYEASNVWMYNYPAGSYLNNSITQLVSTFKSRVSKVLIGFTWSPFQNDTTQLANSWSFANPSTVPVNSIYLTYGSQTFPQIQYRPSLGQGGYGPSQVINTLNRLAGREHDYEGGLPFNFYDWLSGPYCMYGFDLRFQPSSDIVSGQSSDLNVNVSFGTTVAPAITASLQMWVWVATDETLEFTLVDRRTLVSST